MVVDNIKETEVIPEQTNSLEIKLSNTVFEKTEEFLKIHFNKAEEFKAEAQELEIFLEDKESYERVKAYRLKIRKVRLDFTKEIEAAQAPLKKFVKTLSEGQKEIENAYSATEKELDRMETEYEKEVQRIKDEKEAKRMAILNSRIQELAKYGNSMDLSYLEALSEDQFQQHLSTIQVIFEQEKEAKRREEEEINRKAKELADKEALLIKQQQELEAKILAEKAKEEAVQQQKNLEELQAKQILLDKEKELKARENNVAIQERANNLDKQTIKSLDETREKIKAFIPELFIIQEAKLKYIEIKELLFKMKTAKGIEFQEKINLQNNNIISYLDQIINACK